MIDKINNLLKQKENIIIAIDGRCGSGKTTLARELQNSFDCNVIHMDDFFLRPEQRNEERLKTPGGNVDYERFLQEVLFPFLKNQSFSYRPYDCSTQTLGDHITVKAAPITVIEGSYSCHPQLWDYYDIHVFMDIDAETQMERIINRNGAEKAEMFKSRWIPLEELYFKTYNIKEKSEIVINNTL